MTNISGEHKVYWKFDLRRSKTENNLKGLILWTESWKTKKWLTLIIKFVEQWNLLWPPFKHQHWPNVHLGGLPDDSDCQEFIRNAGDPGSIPRKARPPGGRNGNPLWCSGLENSMDKMSLVGSSTWGRKESDTIEWLTLSWSQTFNIHLAPFTCWALGEEI